MSLTSTCRQHLCSRTKRKTAKENEENGKNFIMERFLRQKLDDFSPDLKYTEELKTGARSPIADEEDGDQDEPPAKLPRIISNEEITKTREKLTVNSPVAVQKPIKVEERPLERVAVNQKPVESMKSTSAEKPVIQNQIKPKEEQIEIVEISADQSESAPKPSLVEQIKRHSCHPTGIRPGLAKAPLRVSVIQPTKASITSSSPPLDGAGSPRIGGGARTQSLLDMYPIRHLGGRSSSHHNQHMAANSPMVHHQTGFQAVQTGSNQIRPTVSNANQPMSAFGITAADQTVIKVENPNQLEAYGIRPNHPYVQNAFGPGASAGSGRSSGLGSNSVSASSISQFSGHDGRSFYIKQPYTQSTCHGAPVGRSVPVNRLQGNSTPFSQLSGSSFSGHYPIQPHEQNGSSRSLYSQDDLNRRIMQPGHPPRIRACIERLATRLTVSRHIKEQNEKQVSELLQLACEVKREEECETFYCTWRDCIKHFNRRDSLVRHLRVHVDVRPFKCERCSMHFLRSDHLRVHMLRHTGEQPFACIICGETFSRRDMRNRHMKTIHYRDTLPPQNVLDLLEGESWDAIEIDPDLIRNQNRT